MVVSAIHTLGRAAETADCAAKVIVQLVAPSVFNERFAILGCEHEMVEKTGVGGGHGVRRLAPLPGCGFSKRAIRWCRSCLAQPPATSCKASGFRDGWRLAPLWGAGLEERAIRKAFGFGGGEREWGSH